MSKEGEFSGVSPTEALLIEILTAFYRDLELCVLVNVA